MKSLFNWGKVANLKRMYDANIWDLVHVRFHRLSNTQMNTKANLQCGHLKAGQAAHGLRIFRKCLHAWRAFSCCQSFSHEEQTHCPNLQSLVTSDGLLIIPCAYHQNTEEASHKSKEMCKRPLEVAEAVWWQTAKNVFTLHDQFPNKTSQMPLWA